MAATFRLIHGGKLYTPAPEFSVLPNDELLIGVARFSTIFEDKDIESHLMSLSFGFQHLAGRWVGLLDSPHTPNFAAKSSTCRVRWPHVDVEKFQARWIPKIFFNEHFYLENLGPGPSGKEAQIELLRRCLLADRISDLTEQIYSGLDLSADDKKNLEKKLRWLKDPDAHNKCWACGSEITREAFLILGPGSETCWDCSDTRPYDRP